MQPEPFVIHLQIATPAAHDSFGFDGLNFLRHYADVDFVAPIVAETVKAEAVVETAQQGDIVLKPDVGPVAAEAAPAKPAAAKPAVATAEAAAAKPTVATAEAAAGKTAAVAAAVASAGAVAG